MPVEGSFADDKSLSGSNIRAMMESVASESVKEMKKEIQERTPEKTRKLKESWAETPVVKLGAVYQASVSTDVSYARHVEYGTAPHKITATAGHALKFGGEFYSSVNHPGTHGAYMAMRGAAAFEETSAERIMKDKFDEFMK